MEPKQLQDYLRDEYQILQRHYEDYDQRSLTIKGWVTAAAIAAIALGLDASKNPGGLIWLVVTFFAACVWYLETYWKMFQYAFRDRIRYIEGYFRGEPEIVSKPVIPFQIYGWWFKTHVDDTPLYQYEQDEKKRPKPVWLRFLKSMWMGFVFVPYAPIIAICMAFYCFPWLISSLPPAPGIK